MEQYIPLDALVAEIERLREEKGTFYASDVLYNLEDFIDTLEVKEVDLDKETTHYLLYKHRSPLNEIMHKADLKSEMQYHKDIENAFKAGFELGVRFNNPINATDRGTAEEIIINLKRVEQDYRINLTKEIEWVRNQVKKGE